MAEQNGRDTETSAQVVAAVGDTPMLDEKTGMIVAQLPDGRELLIDWPEHDEEA